MLPSASIGEGGNLRRSTSAFVLCLVALTAAPVFSQGLESPEPPPIDYETAHLSRVVSAVRITEEILLDRSSCKG